MYVCITPSPKDPEGVEDLTPSPKDPEGVEDLRVMLVLTHAT